MQVVAVLVVDVEPVGSAEYGAVVAAVAGVVVGVVAVAEVDVAAGVAGP